jgi:beta-glucuronidase
MTVNLPIVSRFIRAVLFVTGFVAFCAADGQAPLKTLLIDVDHRQTMSLDGPWHYLVDAPGVALYDAKGKVKDTTYAQNLHPAMVGERTGFAEYDFATAPTLNVPGDWNTQEPTLFRYEGVVWYEKDFDFAPRPGLRTFLHVGAANYRSYVWVNGKRICEHEGGFTPFDCEATGVLHAGGNFAVIAVDATRLADGVPSVDVDWNNYGGLTRDVSLVSVPEQFIDDYDAHLVRGTKDTIAGYVHVEGAGAGVPVVVKIGEARVVKTVTTDASGKAAFESTATGLKLWEPGSPKLYKVEMTAGKDRLTDEVGFRDIQVKGTEILLNGKPIFLRGVCVQGEAPYRTGRVATDKDVETIFSWLTDLHANFVRMAHYPYDERMTRMADKLGIMVWSEIPLWQRIQFEPNVYGKADAMLHEMVRRDRNKASIVMWSVANETGNFAQRTDFLVKLIGEAHRLDPTRPVTAALNSQKIVGSTISVNDPLADALDIVGINEYVGWYVGVPALADTLTWSVPQKPLIMSEFGGEGKAGNHGDKERRWTEESQLDIYRHQFAMLAKIPQLSGTAPWILMDFRSPVRNIPKLQDGFNRKGLISNDGEKKLAFEFVKQQYAMGFGRAE